MSNNWLKVIGWYVILSEMFLPALKMKYVRPFSRTEESRKKSFQGLEIVQVEYVALPSIIYELIQKL